MPVFRRSWPDKTRWSDWWLLSATTLLTTSSPQTARPLQSWITPTSWKLSKSQSGSICTSNSKHKRNSLCRTRWCFGALFKQRPLRSNLWRRSCIHRPWMTSCPSRTTQLSWSACTENCKADIKTQPFQMLIGCDNSRHLLGLKLIGVMRSLAPCCTYFEYLRRF